MVVTPSFYYSHSPVLLGSLPLISFCVKFHNFSTTHLLPLLPQLLDLFNPMYLWPYPAVFHIYVPLPSRANLPLLLSLLPYAITSRKTRVDQCK